MVGNATFPRAPARGVLDEDPRGAHASVSGRGCASRALRAGGNLPMNDGGWWGVLAREVGAWREAGREAALWWRDDDAVEPSPALSRLLALRPGCPLGLAVIPAVAKASLAAGLTGAVDVLVHGFAHADHAPVGERKSEYPCGRVAPGEMRAGRKRLEAIFGGRVLPVFVPPWNRMGEDAAVALPAAGYEAVSGYRGRPEGPLPRLDTHVDLIDWRGGRRFAGVEAVLGGLVEALAARRRAEDRRSPRNPWGHQPVGVLSHHLVHDAAAWRFLEDLLAWVEETPGVRWVRPRDALAGRAPAGNRSPASSPCDPAAST